MTNHLISISGELGSGKTSLGKLISEILEYKFISIGSIQRDLAESYGMTLVDFNKYMELHPDIDFEIDNQIKSLADSDLNLIIDSRLAWYFIPNSLKIHLIVNKNVAAQRIINDQQRKNELNTNLKDTIKNITARKDSEFKRFSSLYNININDFKNYNIIIDTTINSTGFLGDFITSKINNLCKEPQNLNVWVSPKNLFPMQGIREHSQESVSLLENSVTITDFIETNPIKVVYSDNNYFIFDGHKRCIAAIRANINLLPVEIINNDTDYLSYHQQVKEFISDNYNIKNIYDWEYVNSFKFASYYNFF